jgi:hypothetical protein
MSVIGQHFTTYYWSFRLRIIDLILGEALRGKRRMIGWEVWGN